MSKAFHKKAQCLVVGNTVLSSPPQVISSALLFMFAWLACEDVAVGCARAITARCLKEAKYDNRNHTDCLSFQNQFFEGGKRKEI